MVSAISTRMERVLYFAAAREAAGIAEETMPLAGLSVVDAERLVLLRHPNLQGLVSRSRWALNATFVAGDARVPAGAELALIPPVAGG